MKEGFESSVPAKTTSHESSDGFHERERDVYGEYMELVSIPDQFPTLEQAYEEMGDDPRFQEGAVNAGYPGRVNRTDKIGMAYFLRDIGAENFRSLADNKSTEERLRLLESVIEGNITATIQNLASEQYPDPGPFNESGEIQKSSLAPELFGVESIAATRYSRDAAKKLKTMSLIVSQAKDAETAEAFVRASFDALVNGTELPKLS